LPESKIDNIYNKSIELLEYTISIFRKYLKNYSVYDARTDLFNLIAGTVQHYIIGWETFRLVQTKITFEDIKESQFFSKSQLFTRVKIEDRVKDSAEKLQAIADMKTYFSKILNHLIFSTWAVFETNINQIYSKIIPPLEITEVKLSIFHKIEKILKDTGVATVDLKKIEKITSIDHIPLPTRYNHILKLIPKEKYESTGRYLNADKETLNLFNDLRNATHDNTLSKKDKEYFTSFGKFSLNKGKLINIVDDEFAIKLIKELVDIIDMMFSHIDHKEEIRINQEYCN
jgi:hypothetical protein